MRTSRLAGVALVCALGLSGCASATDAVVGLHPAPAEQSAAAPLDPDSASVIAAEVLSKSQAALQLTGEEGKAARAATLAGDALTMAEAAAARGLTSAGADALSKAVDPLVVAQSEGREWPRTILATTLDQATSTQYLHVMVSTSATEPYRLTESVPMFAGASLPAVGADGLGTPLVDISDGAGLVASPEEAFAAYAAALKYPKPSVAETVSADDRFATGLQASAAAQAKALGDLGKFASAHTPALENAIAFRLGNGGAVAFGILTRTDTATVAAGAKELQLPEGIAKIVGKPKVTKSVELTSLEPVILIIPTSGKITAIGASELIASGKGS